MDMTPRQWLQLWWLRLCDAAAAPEMPAQGRYDAMMEIVRLENLAD